MKNNNLNDYKKMNEKELEAELKALNQQLFKLRFSLSLNGLDNPHKIVDTKKNIARVSTILTIKKNGGEVVVKEIKEKEAKKAPKAKKTTTKKATKKAAENAQEEEK